MSNRTRKPSKAERQQALTAIGHTKEEALASLAKAQATQPTESEVTQTVAETHDKATAPHSVVRPGYKRAYARKALTEGRTSKADKRCNGDWLARELIAECEEDGIFSLPRFCAICEANGVGDPMARWPNRNNGWEGRLRMSAGIVLRAIVRKRHVLVTPDTTVQVPEAFWQDAQ